MTIRGFRCHSTTVINIESPITAFCGLNGTGKSTLLHLAAVAYTRNGKAKEKGYISEYIVTGTLDPSPFKANASVEFEWQESRKVKRASIRRDQVNTRWLGYKTRPVGDVFYAGIGLYLPKIEIRDFLLRNAGKLTVTGSTAATAAEKQWIQRILSGSYDAVTNNQVKHGSKTGGVVTVERHGSTYSEANMGCGEGRVQHLVQILENLPNKSLILLEEPETSLQQSAQFALGEYLIDVCSRKGHQVMLTTHSEALLRSLPSKSRVFLYRDLIGVKTIRGITSSQAVSLLTEGHDKSVCILVEDDVAQTIMAEIIRRVDPMLLPAVAIHIGGSTDTIKSAMQAVKNSGLNVIAVRDGDQPQVTAENLFKLPGALPPEKEILNSPAVATYLRTNYGYDLNQFHAANGHRDHPEWFQRLGEALVVDRSALIQELSRVYVGNLDPNDVNLLVDILKASII